MQVCALARRAPSPRGTGTETDCRVDKQVVQRHSTGKTVPVRIGPVKCNEASVVIPAPLCRTVDSLDAIAKPMSVRKSLRRAGKKVGVHVRPHQFRHWYATTLLERGVFL